MCDVCDRGRKTFIDSTPECNSTKNLSLTQQQRKPGESLQHMRESELSAPALQDLIFPILLLIAISPSFHSRLKNNEESAMFEKSAFGSALFIYLLYFFL